MYLYIEPQSPTIWTHAIKSPLVTHRFWPALCRHVKNNNPAKHVVSRIPAPLLSLELTWKWKTTCL